MVWSSDQLHTLSGCHVYGGLCPGTRGQVRDSCLLYLLLDLALCELSHMNLQEWLMNVSHSSRHPSNLMLDRMSGKIIHIDFGDCFEVAMVREKFPEKIPFRLTRMLMNAMEVGQTVRHQWLTISKTNIVTMSMWHRVTATMLLGNYKLIHIT